MDYNKDDLEQVINRTYPGLTMFVRDTNLSSELASKYKAGEIIREKGFTDASCRVMGMVTTHRYAILSNHMADLREHEHGTNWGLCVAQRDSHFKIVGTHSYNGKTMIVLLHLPDDNSWKLFENVAINLDEGIFKSCIARFESKAFSEPIAELTTTEWLERCMFPIGMNDVGEFFELE